MTNAKRLSNSRIAFSLVETFLGPLPESERLLSAACSRVRTSNVWSVQDYTAYYVPLQSYLEAFADLLRTDRSGDTHAPHTTAVSIDMLQRRDFYATPCVARHKPSTTWDPVSFLRVSPHLRGAQTPGQAGRTSGWCRQLRLGYCRRK